MRSAPTLTAILAGSALTALLAGCAASPEAPPAGEASGSLDLSTICPADVKIQTGWYPQVEDAPMYQLLLGAETTIDDGNMTVTGPLMVGGESTGVTLTIAAGGPAVGYQTPNAMMYQDPSILLGAVNTGDAISGFASLPVTAVFATMDASPAGIMYDPETYPDVDSIEDLVEGLEETGGTIRTYNGTAGYEYYVANGVIPAEVIEGGYDGSSANFIAAQGRDAQQAYVTTEPYLYENVIEAWKKPVAVVSLETEENRPYGTALSVRSGDLEANADCLAALVPALQQAEADYLADPDATNTLISDLALSYTEEWPYTKDAADFATSAIESNSIMSDGDNGYVGDFDPERMTSVVAIAIEYSANPDDLAGLTAEDIYTNEFLDTSISIGR